MTRTHTCEGCGGDLRLTETVVARESTGFGPHNEQIYRFCSAACRARWRGDDPVLAETRQATLALFRGGAQVSTGSFTCAPPRDPDAIVWGL